MLYHRSIYNMKFTFGRKFYYPLFCDLMHSVEAAVRHGNRTSKITSRFPKKEITTLHFHKDTKSSHLHKGTKSSHPRPPECTREEEDATKIPPCLRRAGFFHPWRRPPGFEPGEQAVLVPRAGPQRGPDSNHCTTWPPALLSQPLRSIYGPCYRGRRLQLSHMSTSMRVQRIDFVVSHVYSW